MTQFNIVQTAPLALTAKIAVGRPEKCHRYLGVAEALAKGLRPLASTREATTAMAFLAAQVLETALKAYILKTNPTADVKSPPDNHNIVKLWQRCRSAGLPIEVDAPSVVKLLSSLHSRPYPLRYADEDQVRLIFAPKPDDVCIAVEAVLQLVAKSIN